MTHNHPINLYVQNAIPSDVVSGLVEANWTEDDILNKLFKPPSRISKEYKARVAHELLNILDEKASDDFKEAMNDIISESLCTSTNQTDDDAFCWVNYTDTWIRVLNPYFSKKSVTGHAQIGLRLWEAEVCCLEYLEYASALVKDKRVLEVGAGVGLAGIAAVERLGARHLIISDFSIEVLENLRRIVKQSPAANKIEIRGLDWHFEEQVKTFHDHNFIIAADCVYDPTDIDNFINTIETLLVVGVGTTALIACSVRNEKTYSALRARLNRSPVLVEKVSLEKDQEVYSNNASHMFTKKWSRSSVALMLLRRKNEPSQNHQY